MKLQRVQHRRECCMQYVATTTVYLFWVYRKARSIFPKRVEYILVLVSFQTISDPRHLASPPSPSQCSTSHHYYQPCHPALTSNLIITSIYQSNHYHVPQASLPVLFPSSPVQRPSSNYLLAAPTHNLHHLSSHPRPQIHLHSLLLPHLSFPLSANLPPLPPSNLQRRSLHPRLADAKTRGSDIRGAFRTRATKSLCKRTVQSIRDRQRRRWREIWREGGT